MLSRCSLIQYRGHARIAPGRALVQVHASAGFGKSNKKVQKDTTTGTYTRPTRKRRVNLVEELGDAIGAPSTTTAPAAAPVFDPKEGNWIEVASDVSSVFTTKSIKVVQLAAGQTLVLYQYKDIIFCSDAYSTAYKFPLVDANVYEESSGPAVEVPLDGTVYDLATGEVLKWCPKGGSLFRDLLGTLKKDQDPIPLPVYPVRVEAGKVYVKLI